MSTPGGSPRNFGSAQVSETRVPALEDRTGGWQPSAPKT